MTDPTPSKGEIDLEQLKMAFAELEDMSRKTLNEYLKKYNQVPSVIFREAARAYLAASQAVLPDDVKHWLDKTILHLKALDSDSGDARHLETIKRLLAGAGK